MWCNGLFFLNDEGCMVHLVGLGKSSISYFNLVVTCLHIILLDAYMILLVPSYLNG